MSHNKKLLPLLISAVFSASSFASQSSVTLEPISVVESRLHTDGMLPANVTILSKEEISASSARTLPDLISTQAGIAVRSLYNHASKSTIDMRGFGATGTQNTLILLDGRRVNDIDLSAINYSAIPLENIERIEIIRGSGSVLYGDGASGGVINIITKDPHQSKNYTKLSTSMGSHDHIEGNAFIAASNERVGVTANINSSSNNGYRDNNEFEQHSGHFDIRVPVSNGELYWKVGGYNQDIQLPGVRTVSPSTFVDQLSSDRKGTDTPNDWADEKSQFTTIGWTHALTPNDTLIVDAGYKNKDQNSQYFAWGGTYSETEIETLSFTPRLKLNRQMFELPVTVNLGLDIYQYNYESDRSNLKQNIGQPAHKLDVKQNSRAFYSSAAIDLTKSTQFNAGWRIQRVSQEARDSYDASAPGAGFGSEAADLNKADTEDSFEIGIQQALTPNLSLYARHDRSARFGNVDELFEFNSLFQQVFSPLDPQISKNFEIGAQFEKDAVFASFSIFHQKVSDEIHYDPISFQNINLDDTQHDGIELSAKYQLSEKFNLHAAYTYLNAEFTDGNNDGNEIPLVAKHSYDFGISGSLLADISYALNWKYVSATHFENDESNTFGQKIPSYQTVALKLSRSFDNLDLSLNIQNLFDEEYYTYGVSSTSVAGRYNAYPLAERTVYFSAAYTFD